MPKIEIEVPEDDCMCCKYCTDSMFPNKKMCLIFKVEVEFAGLSRWEPCKQCIESRRQ